MFKRRLKTLRNGSNTLQCVSRKYDIINHVLVVVGVVRMDSWKERNLWIFLTNTATRLQQTLRHTTISALLIFNP